ncbi:MAG: ATPase [Rhodospirillaceae bacterium]|nr:ATPase [Rhodospirillales bacterium]
MLNKTIKRFYKQADVAEAEGGFAIRLDGRPIKTPAGKQLIVPSRALADAMAAEWDEQGENVFPALMPMTQLSSTALDRVGPERAVILEQIARFAGTDLLCYRAEFPADLVARQTSQWQPLLDWASHTMGACLRTTVGVIAVEQPVASLAQISGWLATYDTWRLTVAQSACAACGSLVLALALVERRITGEEAFALSQLDETFQIEQWGEDYEAADRRDVLKRDILAAERFLKLV